MEQMQFPEEKIKNAQPMAGGKGMASLQFIRVGHGVWENKMTLGKWYTVYKYLSFRFGLKEKGKISVQAHTLIFIPCEQSLLRSS